MNKLTIAVIAAALNTSMAFGGMAQSAPCSCVSGLAASNTIVGTIVKTSGDVFYSGENGYVQAKAGAKLVTGSQVSVGANSSANLLVGATCKVNVPANSEVSILAPKAGADELCVRVSSLAETPQEGSSTQAVGGVGFSVMAGLVVGGAVAGAVIATNSDNTVIPTNFFKGVSK